MNQIDVEGAALKNLLVRIGTTDYEKHVSDCNFVPSRSPITWQGGTPDAQLVDAGTPTWAYNMTLVQDYSADSLWSFLLEHDGEQATITYKPDAAGTIGFTSTITLAAAQLGAAVGGFPTASVSGPATKPERVTVAAGA